MKLARFLAGEGVRLTATEGTAVFLRRAGVRVAEVSKITRFPAILDGRVKTLHPAVFGGILGDPRRPSHRRDLARHKIAPIGLVVVNLYPFEKTASRRGASWKECMEQIDIGGVALLRAAAKNYENVVVLCDPADYEPLMKTWKERRGAIPLEERARLAEKAFLHTARYDALIAASFSRKTRGTPRFDAECPPRIVLALDRAAPLRYGENPHQRGDLYVEPLSLRRGAAGAKILQGKSPSFNNYFDADAAWRLVSEWEEPSCVVVKHGIPCGAALGKTAALAFRRAFDADSVSAFGGIAAFNAPVDEKTANALKKIFLELVMAPSFTKGALKILSEKKNLRLFACGRPARPQASAASDSLDAKRVLGGWLLQDWDVAPDDEKTWRVVTRKKLADRQKENLRFAWTVVKHVRSNAIVVAKGGVTLGVGAGQASRVDAVRLALARAGEKAKGAVLASDGFFPFRDSVDEAAKSGIAAMIQPGGSIRDAEVVRACDRHNIAMIFTGQRHFRH